MNETSIGMVRAEHCVFYMMEWECSDAQSGPTLCNPTDCSLPGFSVRGIFQAGILEWVAISSSGDLPNPGIKPASFVVPALAGGFFITRATWEAMMKYKVSKIKVKKKTSKLKFEM